MALPTYNVEEPRLPLKLGEQCNLFKLFMNDVGLLASQYAANKEDAIPRAIVFSNGNVQVVGKILYYPIYMLMHLQPEMIKNPIFRFEPI